MSPQRAAASSAAPATRARLLHLNRSGQPQGGAERWLEQLAQLAGASGFDNQLLTADSSPPVGPLAAALEPYDGATPDLIVLHAIDSADETRLLARFAKTPRLRVVHDLSYICPRVHRYFPGAGRVCRLRPGWGCVLCGAWVVRGEGRLPVALDSQRIQRTLRRLARDKEQGCRYLVASAYTAHELARAGISADRINLVPPAIDLPPPSTIKPRPGRLLFVGQLVRGKGLDLLFAALAQVDGPWELAIAGAGPDEDKLRAAIAERRWEQRVQLLGRLERAELDAELAAAQLAVVPSRAPETFALSGPEALAAGCPVVAFAVGAIPEWLEHGSNGLLVAEQDVDGLARAISELLADPRRCRALGARGRQRVAERFMFEKTAAGLLAALRDALPPKPSTRLSSR